MSAAMYAHPNLPAATDPDVGAEDREIIQRKSMTGAGALATGLVEVPWLLRVIRERVAAPPAAFMKWDDFLRAGRGLLLWEAFVTGSAKRDSHANDAVAAVEAFRAALPDPTRAHALLDSEVLSLLGATMLRTGWTSDLMVLAAPTLVIRA